MKKFVVAALSALMVLSLLAGCGNRTIFDTTYTFKRAIISLPNGEVVEGAVTSWTDYEDGDQLQITIDGVTYLTHSSNVCLMTGD